MRERTGNDAQAAPVPPGRSGIHFFLTSFGIATILGLAIYFPTLRTSYAYDDIDYLNRAADVLAGKAQFWRQIFLPQGEHVLPLLRSVMIATAAAFGTNATPLRVLVLLCHILSATWIALISRRYLNDDRAACLAGALYVFVGGFSSMWIWFPSGGCVPIGLAAIYGGLAAIVYRHRIGRGRARLLAVAGVVIGLAADSTLAPLAAGPALLDAWQEWRQRKRLRSFGFAAGLTGLAIGFMVIMSKIYAGRTGLHIRVDLRHALPKSAFLIGSAPFRLFFPGLFLPRPMGFAEWFPTVACLCGLVITLLVSVVALNLESPNIRPLLAAAFITLPGAFGFVLLVGIGRWKSSYEELYDADRYFFFFLPFIALFGSAIWHRIREVLRGTESRKRIATILLFVAAASSEFWLQRSAVLRRIPFEIYAAHERRFQQLSLLARELSRAAAELPSGHPQLKFPDMAFDFPDVHLHRLSARFLLFVVNRERPVPVILSSTAVPDADAVILNGALDRWARQIGEDIPYFSIRGGALVNARDSNEADFRVNPCDGQVLEGLYQWDGMARWMGDYGEISLIASTKSLELVAAVPWTAIHRLHPDWDALKLNLTLTDDSGPRTIDLGTLSIADDAIQSYRIPITSPGFRAFLGRPVRLGLRADHVWRPVDVLAGSRDIRTLTVQIYKAGFVP